MVKMETGGDRKRVEGRTLKRVIGDGLLKKRSDGVHVLGKDDGDRRGEGRSRGKEL